VRLEEDFLILLRWMSDVRGATVPPAVRFMHTLRADRISHVVKSCWMHGKTSCHWHKWPYL
jgi:hypothetical protein